MMNATGSPIRPVHYSKDSDMAHTLEEAEKLENHYSEVEQARMALEEAKRRRLPPPPPPASPRSRALNRVLELARKRFEENDHVDYETKILFIEELKSVVNQVMHEHVQPEKFLAVTRRLLNFDHEENIPSKQEEEIVKENDVHGEFETRLTRRNVPNPNDVFDLIIGKRTRENYEEEILAGPGRFWRAAITSATLRHGRVEYEIRSELTSVSEKKLEITTGTSVVRRRYRDFDRLKQSIIKSLKSSEFVLIPNLPPKDIGTLISGNRADPNFVWDRRVGLQLWLRYVCDHNVIRNSTLLREFLWEPSSSAVSNDSKKFEDMNVASENALWRSSLQTQQLLMENRFGNSVVALTSMSTHITGLISSYHRASLKAKNLILADASLARSLARASKVFKDWADFERSAGQNYGFVNKFALELPARDANRPTPLQQHRHQQYNPTGVHQEGLQLLEDALVSFSERDFQANVNPNPPSKRGDPHSSFLSKGHVDAPISLGASGDIRSLKAFQNLLFLWGDEILPSLNSNFVDPKETSPYYREFKKKLSTSSVLGNRVACEWTEIERLKLEMIRDGGRRMVEDQIYHAQEEIDRWEALRGSIMAQEVEISSLVALTDAPTTTNVNKSNEQTQELSSSLSSSSSLDSKLDHSVKITSTSANIINHSNTTTESTETKYDGGFLDENLEAIQARFKDQENNPIPNRPIVFDDDENAISHYRNPFDDDD